jgi:polysaccharide export outer membrane protein
VTTFPEQMVGQKGTINIPFAGQVQVAGRNAQQVEADIAQRLATKANQPQVLLRVTQNNTSTVTVIGDVTNSHRMPLTARGERLLDAFAAAGGMRQATGGTGQTINQNVNRMALQITRGDQIQALPLVTIIQDPQQNILLRPGDVVTALFQSMSFTVLGAAGTNAEISFEAQGISLAQALARANGLQDTRADASGIYIFRLEDGNALPWKTPPARTPEGKVPVVYRVNLKDPATFFVAQTFPIENRDVLYAANASGADLQKFLNLVLTAVYPALSLINAARGF